MLKYAENILFYLFFKDDTALRKAAERRIATADTKEDNQWYSGIKPNKVKSSHISFLLKLLRY